MPHDVLIDFGNQIFLKQLEMLLEKTTHSLSRLSCKLSLLIGFSKRTINYVILHSWIIISLQSSCSDCACSIDLLYTQANF